MDPTLLILLIGASGPIIGSAIGVLKKPSDRFTFGMLAFAAGVMIAISLLELLPQAITLAPLWGVALGLALGTVLMYGVDKIIPHIHPETCKQRMSLHRTAIFLLIGIFIHNFPEGLAIASGTIIGFRETLIIAIAIGIHNIPEGICTSAPYYYCTKKRLETFLLSASTAIPIVLGFVMGKFLFAMISPVFVGILVSLTAGVMMYISADELIPASISKHQSHWDRSRIFSFMIGIVFVLLLGHI